MKIIQSLPRYIGGVSRQQMQFNSLDDLVAADNPVRILDVFAEKLDPIAIGLEKTRYQSQ